MIPWLILMGLLWYGILAFTRSVQPAIRPDHDVVAEAERLTGARRRDRRWLRPTVATAIAWAALMAALTPVDPTLAVWIGGGMIMVGAVATALSLPDPTRMADADFDAALRDLLDQYS